MVVCVAPEMCSGDIQIHFSLCPKLVQVEPLLPFQIIIKMLKFAHRRPEPSPRSSHLRLPHTDYYGSVSSLSKSSDFRGSTNSLSSTCSSANTSGTYQRTLKKRRAPLPPAMREANSAEILLSPSPRKSSNASMASDQSGQVRIQPFVDCRLNIEKGGILKQKATWLKFKLILF